MSKITLTPVSNPQNLTSLQTTINANNSVIQTAFDNTLSRDGTTPDQMLFNLDMNNNQILNLPAPASMNSPARMQDVVSNPTVTVPALGTSGAAVGLLNTGWTQSGNNTWTGTNNYTNSVSFSSITLPANSVNSSNVTDGSLLGTDLAANTVANSNLSQMAANTIKGNNTGGLGNALDLTVSQVSAMLGSIANTGTVKTANYTIVNADNGSTFLLGGGSFYTITVGALAGYSSTFSCRIVNQDTGRAKAITISGFSTFLLWPGQSTTVLAGSGTWIYTDPGRWRKPGASYFVDPSNGNDSNDGLASGTSAFRTIGAAILNLYQTLDAQNAAPTINLASGTYTESVSASGQLTGYNFFYINTPGFAGCIWKPTTNYHIIVGDNAEVIFTGSGITFDGNGVSNLQPVNVHQTGVIDMNCISNFQNMPSATLFSLDQGGGSLNIGAQVFVNGNINTIVNAGPRTSVTNTNYNTTTTGGTCTSVYITTGGFISLNGSQTFTTNFSAGTKYTATLNGAIALAGLTLPAPSAGVTASGGVAA